jgi:DNA-binding CsgD family transcriptional regulator
VYSRPTSVPDWIGILEAAYALDQPDDAWLGGMLGAASPCLDEGMGVVAFLYDASDPLTLRVHQMAQVGVSAPRLEAYFRVSEQLAAIPGFLQRTYRSLLCGTMSELERIEYDWREAALACGVGDTLAVNGLDPSGKGCLLGVFLPEETALPSRRRQLLSYIATHLANAHRLRTRMRVSGQNPVAELEATDQGFEPATSGEEHVTSALARAAGAIASARGPLRFAEDGAAVAGWQGLVQRRFTLVDAPERPHRGRRRMLAFENQPQVAGFAALTDREREVAAYLMLGHSTKVIAYELGISDSTVRVLLRRVRHKLNVDTRADLMAALRAASRDPGQGT